MPNQPSEYGHLPVLADKVVDLMVTDIGGAYLDLTLGLGGHVEALSDKLESSARIYGVDRDADAVAQAEKRLTGRANVRKLIAASYGDLAGTVEQFEDQKFDGMLVDLGLSSSQLDDPERGFSHRFDGPLDMRFDLVGTGLTAGDLINSWDEKRLTKLIRDFGEDRNAARIAAQIVRERQEGMILTTSQLADIVSQVVREQHRNKTLARVFQAFRIAVNRELEILENALPVFLDHLRAGGRLVVIAYHSLEDRIVKNFFRTQARGCICPPEIPICVCDRIPTIELVTRRVIKAEEAEIRNNPRARSARLRVVQKV